MGYSSVSVPTSEILKTANILCQAPTVLSKGRYPEACGVHSACTSNLDENLYSDSMETFAIMRSAKRCCSASPFGINEVHPCGLENNVVVRVV